MSWFSGHWTLRGAVVGVVALLTLGCAGGPRYRVQVGDDLVRASDPDVAADVAALLTHGRELLARQVPGLDDTSVEVWVQEKLDAGEVFIPGFSSAFVLKRPGQRPRIHVLSRGYRNAFLHELTHALLDEDWEPLPVAVEEGLCEVLSHEMADAAVALKDLSCAARAGASSRFRVSIQVRQPDGAPKEYSTLWGTDLGSDSSTSTLTVAEILAFSGPRDLNALSAAEVPHVYGVGFLVVRLIVASSGINGLRELCLRASAEGLQQIPVEWLLEASGIESEEHFQALALEALRSESIRAAFESSSFQDVLRAALGDDAGASAGNADEFLSRVTGTLRVNREHIDLLELPAFRSWFSASWDSLKTLEGE